MKPKKKHFFILFFSILISGVFFVPQNVNAISYYNWLQNPSFLAYSNYIEDSGFESGIFESGLIYGNWSGDSSFQGSYVNTGLYAIQCDGGEFLYYNFTSDYYTLGADVVNFTFYGVAFAANKYFYWSIFYSDASGDSGSILLTDSWAQYCLLDEIDTNKVITSIQFEKASTYTGFIDDVVIMVDDGIGQDYIGLGTNPWGCDDYRTQYTILNSTFGRLDSFSTQFNQAYLLRQIINFLDTDAIHFINCYVYGLSSTEGIKCLLKYSDGSESSVVKYGSGDGESWTFINFGNAFITGNKYLRTVYFERGTTGAIFNLDDAGVWCSVPYGYSRFDYSITPTPISKTLAHFEVYMETSYTFFGFIYNQTDGELNENGTYTFTDSFGAHSGNVTNGQFNLALNERTGNVRRTENVTVFIRITTTDEILFFEIVSYWNPLSGGNAIIDTGDAEQTSNFILNFLMYGIFFIAIPLTMSFYVGGVNNPSLGVSVFIASETLMGAIALSIGFINLWFMVAIIILDILLIVAMVRGR